jgi:hypothetical protein
MKRSTILLLCALIVLRNFQSKAQGDNETVKISETYELANIILAITPYGKEDQWEVSKDSKYYGEVIQYFNKYANHPLINKVNYSREKWESYLSFRTDSYAFSFNSNNKIVRQFDYYTNKGFKPFDENIDLVDDFIEKTNFRAFYKSHKTYYSSLATAYLVSQKYPEMKSFLEKEFGERSKNIKYAIVISPLVGRMNCHRKVATVETDFITLPNYLLKDEVTSKPTEQDIASGTHMLFTEFDHGFVNPVTEAYRTLVEQKFNNNKWDKGSGYDTDSLSVFNEYMTWGLYDLFIDQYFPNVSEQVKTDWTLQNESRGFYASSLFTDELKRLYKVKNGKIPVKDLYPELINKLSEIQGGINQPKIINCNLDKAEITDSVATFVIHFSESMQELDFFDIVSATDKKGTVQKKQQLTKDNNQIAWSDNGTVLTFKRNLTIGCKNFTAFTVPGGRGTSVNIKSKQGINLPLTTVITTSVTAKK